MALLFLHDNRRKYRRGKIPGVAVLQNDAVTGANLVDVSVGGMKVLSKSWLPKKSHVSVEFKFSHIDYGLVPGKPIKAKLVHSERSSQSGTYALGFRFFELNEIQKKFLEGLTKPQSAIN